MVEAWLFSPTLRHRTTVDAHLFAWFGPVATAWTTILRGALTGGNEQALHEQWITFIIDQDSRRLPRAYGQLVPTVMGICFTEPAQQEATADRQVPVFLSSLLHGFAGHRRVRFLDWAPQLWLRWAPIDTGIHRETLGDFCPFMTLNTRDSRLSSNVNR